MKITMNNIEHFMDFDKIDFKNIEWVEPIFITMIMAYGNEKNIDLKNIPNSYTKQMIIGDFKANTTYTPIECILTRGETEKISNHLTTIMLQNFNYIKYDEDKTDLKDYIQYLFAELLNNVPDHAYSPVGGYAMAQYYPTKKRIQFAIADRGVGILNNVQLKSNIDNEKDAILKALEKGFTATKATIYSQEKNAGYGLFAMKEILKETGGRFIIISNDTIARYNNDKITFSKLDTCWNGVVVCFEFYEKNINLNIDDFKRTRLWNDLDDEDDFF